MRGGIVGDAPIEGVERGGWRGIERGVRGG